jgi:hypothetical protein
MRDSTLRVAAPSFSQYFTNNAPAFMICLLMARLKPRPTYPANGEAEASPYAYFTGVPMVS